MRIRFQLDGHETQVEAQPLQSLASVLAVFRPSEHGCRRADERRLVLLDGLPVHPCHVPVVQLEGARVDTLDSVALDERLRAFERSLPPSRCVHCTPALLIACASLLFPDESPSAEEIRDAIGPDICGCGSAGRFLDRLLAALESSDPSAAAKGSAPEKHRRKRIRRRTAARKARATKNGSRGRIGARAGRPNRKTPGGRTGRGRRSPGVRGKEP